MPKKIISASILAADFTRLGEEVKDALDAGVDYIHFDVMDNHFVPNLSFGAVICQSLRKAGVKAPIDVHLMVKNPLDFIKPFADAGASLLTFHPETVNDVQKTIHEIKKIGMGVGLAFNPDKPLQVGDTILKELDLILLMSVFPGFAGQKFIPSSLEKISRTRHLLDQINGQSMLGIDGGIKSDNIGDVAKAGADFFVVGSGLFHASHYKDVVKKMRHEFVRATD